MTPILITFGISLLGGAAHWFNIPLTWIIGPLITVGIARIVGMNLKAPSDGRQLSQSAVGVADSKQMTPPVVFFYTRKLVCLWLQVSSLCC